MKVLVEIVLSKNFYDNLTTIDFEITTFANTSPFDKLWNY